MLPAVSDVSLQAHSSLTGVAGDTRRSQESDPLPVDRPTIALAGVRAARGELCRAAGLLRHAIRAAAGEGVSVQRLARAAGTSVDQVRRIAGVLDERRDASAVLRSDRGERGDAS